MAALAINPNTVLKAYRELEHRGLAAGRPGQGTFVEGTLGHMGLPELAALRRTLQTWLGTADAAGLDEAGIVALFTSALRDFGERRGDTPAAGPRAAAPRSGAAARPGGRGGAMNIIESTGLGKRYRRTWALRDCTLGIPGGHVAAVVGPNGAGKTTMLQMAVGLITPTAGSVTVLGGERPGSPDALDRIAFVAQDAPLYKNLPAGDMLHLARNLNRRWDQPYAEARLADLDIPLTRKVGKLSGGQKAQLALTVALARRPDLLVLDEPLAMLDPLARHDFMGSVMAAVAEDGVSVVLSSHVLAELERVADYLIVLSRGRVQMTGDVDDLLAGHRVLTGPAAEADAGAAGCASCSPPRRGAVPPAGQDRRRTPTPTRCRRAGRRTASAWKNSSWPTSASPAPRHCQARSASGTPRG